MLLHIIFLKDQKDRGPRPFQSEIKFQAVAAFLSFRLDLSCSCAQGVAPRGLRPMMLMWVPILQCVQNTNSHLLVLWDYQIVSLLFKDILLGFLDFFSYTATEIHQSQDGDTNRVWCCSLSSFFTATLAPQVSNLCLSILMGWSKVLLDFPPLNRGIHLPFS